MDLSIDRQTAVTALAVFIVATGAAFFAGAELFDQKEPVKYHSFPDITADNDNNIATVEFDNQTIDMMYESSDSFKAYLDLDRDGSFDKRLDNLTHDGEEHEFNEIITLGDQSYRLYFRYKDSGQESDDGYITLYRIREL